jgi:hypothetical protein
VAPRAVHRNAVLARETGTRGYQGVIHCRDGGGAQVLNELADWTSSWLLTNPHRDFFNLRFRPSPL